MEVDAGIILVYLFLFVALVLLILMLSPKTSSVTYVDNVRAPQPMVEVCNPFSLQLCQSPEGASLRRFRCTIKSGMSCLVQAFWGVNILDLFSTLQRDCFLLRDQLLNDVLLLESCLSRSSLICESPCNKEFDFIPETVIDEAVLGESLRKLYPLVVLIFVDDLGNVPSQPSVAGLVSAIHIKDSLVNLDTHVIGQYLKLSNNRLCSLSNLYVSSDPTVSESDTYCVVCQAEVASTATLPCRHLCTCQNCFSQLQRCPVCRSMIHSYFITRA